MQIHELTQRPLKEGVLGALASGVAKQATQQFVQSQTGIGPDQYAGQRVAVGQRPEAALKMNTQLLQQMAKKGQEAWTVTQQELAKRANPPVASAAYLAPQELEPHLTKLIQQLVGFDFNKDSDFGNSPEVNMGMKVAKNNINKSIDTILKLTKEKPDQAKRALEATWLDLATKGIGPMQTYAQQAQSLGRTTASARPESPAHPDAVKLTQALGQQSIDAISRYATGKTITKTGIPALDGLLAAAGATLR